MFPTGGQEISPKIHQHFIPGLVVCNAIKPNRMRVTLTILNLFLIFTLTNQELLAQDKKSKKELKQEYLKNIKKDSMNGVYIPMNLNDCFKQIDGFWTDSVK
jgi:hypothetical protein